MQCCFPFGMAGGVRENINPSGAAHLKQDSVGREGLQNGSRDHMPAQCKRPINEQSSVQRRSHAKHLLSPLLSPRKHNVAQCEEV